MNFRYYKTGKLIPFIIVLAIVSSYVSSWIEELLVHWSMISKAAKWIDLFSILTLVVSSLAFINNIGWKWKFFRWLIRLPNLNGRYTGTLNSSYISETTGMPIKMRIAVEIKQSASSIHIYGYFADFGSIEISSRSYSVSEQIIEEQNGMFLVYYIFTNESAPLKEMLSNHLGSASLKYYQDIQTLDGNYYNQRGNKGDFVVKFVQKKLLHRLNP